MESCNYYFCILHFFTHRIKYMKKALITQMPEDLPKEIKNFISDAPIYDSSSSPEARVYFVDKDEGYYLKRANLGKLAK